MAQTLASIGWGESPKKTSWIDWLDALHFVRHHYAVNRLALCFWKQWQLVLR
jgi:hypothetical protein